MASAKYLEEALSADVDESAVSALVGSLETQLVTTTPTASNQQGNSTSVNQNHVNSAIANGGTVSAQKHGVTNGGTGSINILGSDGSKTITTSSLQSSNVIHSGVVNTVVAPLPGGVPSSSYINQVSPSQSLSTLSKQPESVKLVYPSGSQTLNSRVAFQHGALPNGNLGLAQLTTQTVLNAVTSAQNVVTQTHSQSVSTVTKPLGNVIGVEHGKTQGATLVIKASGSPVTQGSPLSASVVTVPVTVNNSMTLTGTYVNPAGGTTTTSGMSGVVTLAKPVAHTVGTSQTIVGNPPTTLLPTNVQIVNVNAVRPSAPGQQGQKNVASRVVIGSPHMVGARPGQPGQITLQTLQGLQPGTQGHLLLKTESGQYQLLRVGPAPTTPGAAIAPTANAALPTAQTYRIQSVPAQNAVAVATTTSGSTAIQASQPPALASTQNAAVQRTTVDTTKEKCRKFLANLLELSSREPKAVERNVRTLIQELIDTKVEPEEFCDRLERLLNASPQPCLIGFLKKSLPLLRQSLVTKELVIDGIRPPPHTVVFSIPNSTNVPQLQPSSCSTSFTVMKKANHELRCSTPTVSPPPLKSCSPQKNNSPFPSILSPVIDSGKIIQPAQSATTTSLPTVTGPTQQRIVLRPTSPEASSVLKSEALVRQLQAQLRPQAAAPTQVRLMTPINAAAHSVGVATLPRTVQTAHRLVTPVRTSVPVTRMVSSTTLRPHSPVTTSSPSLPANSTAIPQVRVSPPSLAAPPLHLKQNSIVSTKSSPPVQLKSPPPVQVKQQTFAKAVSIPVKPMAPSILPKPPSKEKEKKTFSSAGYTGDDDINDVAAMGGVNLAEETQRILGSTEFVGTQIRSCKDEMFLHSAPLQQRIRQIVAKHGLEEPPSDVAALISHACQERLKSMLEKLALIAEHRIDIIKLENHYEVTQDVKGQLKFLEELDRVERKRHEEHERELLLRAAKSRSKSEVPEQAKLKAKAKEMLRAEMEELRQQEANLTALQAIGPRKKPKLDYMAGVGSSGLAVGGVSSAFGGSVGGRTVIPIRPRLKRVNIRDLLFLLEQERETSRSPFLFRAYLK